MRIKIFFAFFLLAVSSAFAGEEISYRPNLHGTIRSRWEINTEDGYNRFQVRNARLMLDGKIAPSIDYYLNTDFCDGGKIKILDVWARMKVCEGLRVQAGQFRMPFGADPFRGPHTYYFANRSVIGKQVCNVRAVGAKLMYSFPRLPLSVEAGLFNPTPIGEHMVWNRKFAYAGKVSYQLGNVKLTAGVQSILPDSIRINLVDGAVTWTNDRWIVEGEYMYKHYTSGAHKPCHAYNVFADYHMPVRLGVFNRLSFQARVDGMTAHSNGVRDDSGALVTNDSGRNRLTVGSTISYRRNSMFVDIRANFEKYFYRSGVDPLRNQKDKLVLELVLRF